MAAATVKTVALSGSTGLVGRALTPLLTSNGMMVRPLVRKKSSDASAILMDVASQKIEAEKLEGVDAVVHLAGENIGERWSAAKKKAIRESRVLGTRLLCETLAKLSRKPSVLVCASATGFYGERGDEVLTENCAPGGGFLADVCKEWEAATQAAEAAGIRVVRVRLGIVLAPGGGALAKMLLPFKLGVGGVLGSGNQFWSWIELDDVIGAIRHALLTPSISGAVNLTAPTPATNREFTKALGRVLSRPTILPAPAFALKMMLGEMAKELLLTSTRAVPDVLQKTGYVFRYPELDGALRHAVGR
jgi:hypothetical protein